MVDKNMTEELYPDNIKQISNKVSVPGLLRCNANLFESRNAEYGTSYKQIGHVLKSYFPDGLNLKTEEDFLRFAQFHMIAGKLGRYATNFNKGGHQDSLDDISVYSAMLNEIDMEDK